MVIYINVDNIGKSYHRVVYSFTDLIKEVGGFFSGVYNGSLFIAYYACMISLNAKLIKVLFTDYLYKYSSHSSQ